jgi:hypothetical protein
MIEWRKQFSEAVQSDSLDSALLIITELVDKAPQVVRDTILRFSASEQNFFFKHMDKFSKVLPNDLSVDVYKEALRTNSQELLATLVLDNNFPAKALPTEAFNQMVLKALFFDYPVESISGIKTRLNPLLKTQIVDFKKERLSADRKVPRGVEWLLKQFADQEVIHATNI